MAKGCCKTNRCFQSNVLGGIIGNQVHGECGLGYAVDNPIVEGEPVEQ